MNRKAKAATSIKPITVTIDIRPGPALPARKQAWKRLWQKLIAEARASE